jgi:iron complex transport system ATP-binding protein
MIRLSADDILVRFDGRTALNGISTTVAAGEIVGLIGPNGAGKTTLLRVCANLLDPQSGMVRFEDQPVAKMAPRDLARSLAFLPSGAPCHWPIEVNRLVALGRLPYLPPWTQARPIDAAAIDAAIEMADVQEFRGRNVDELSDGERARVMLARALAGEPRLLLADEPVAGLDPRHQLTVMEVLAGLSKDGASVVVTLHDLSLATRYCNRLILLDAGAIVAEGKPADVLTKQNLAQVFGIEAIEGNRDGIPFILPWTPIGGGGDG